MAKLDFTGKQIDRMVEVLAEDHFTMRDAAIAALDTAIELLEERAGYTVVGQVVETKDKGKIKPNDPDAVKVALGWYSTKGKADAAADSFVYNAASGDRLNVWVLPVFHGTPSGWHKEQRDKLSVAAAKAEEKAAADFKRKVEESNIRMEQRAQEIREREKAAGGQQWPCTRWTPDSCRHTPACVVEKKAA